MKIFFKIIYYIVITAVVFIALLIIVSAFPINGNIKMFTVLSGSMEPTIHTGSVVVIKPVSNYKVGDIVTFGQNTKTELPTTHRISGERIQDGEKVFKTKGDANNGEDGKEISSKEILGKILFSIPWLGYVVDFVKKPMGLMIVIVIPAVIIVYDQLQKILKEMKKLTFKMKKVEEEVLEISEAEFKDEEGEEVLFKKNGKNKK